MDFETLRSCEALGANFTLERPLVGVNANMSFQLTRLFEALWANFAAERPLTSVNSVMNLEIGRFRELFGADLAAERFLDFSFYAMPLSILLVLDLLWNNCFRAS